MPFSCLRANSSAEASAKAEALAKADGSGNYQYSLYYMQEKQ